MNSQQYIPQGPEAPSFFPSHDMHITKSHIKIYMTHRIKMVSIRTILFSTMTSILYLTEPTHGHRDHIIQSLDHHQRHNLAHLQTMLSHLYQKYIQLSTHHYHHLGVALYLITPNTVHLVLQYLTSLVWLVQQIQQYHNRSTVLP